MISHSLNDDDTVTIRDGIKTLTVPMRDAVNLAYAIIDDLDPTGEDSPVNRLVNPGNGTRPRYGAQKLAMLKAMSAGKRSATYLGQLIGRSSNHAAQQLLRMQRMGFCVSSTIPGTTNRKEWEITAKGRHWLAVN
jgi:DNA-binding HxlR family transcriptional regulator